MAKFTTHKSTPQGKATTVTRRIARAGKYASTAAVTKSGRVRA